MQTFLPYKSFYLSLNCLDYRRLGKQRVEAKQILDILQDPNTISRWRNHPAVKMWRGYENSLKYYHDLAIILWKARGYKNNMPLLCNNINSFIHPDWLTNEFCEAHRSNLLRKKPEYYSKFGWDIPDNLPYIWPVR